jgi:D-alanyl-D-alanine carboxypeptidase
VGISRRQVCGVAAAVALVGVAAVGGAGVDAATAAPRASTLPQAPAAGRPAAAMPAPVSSPASGSALPRVLAATGHLHTRLSLTVTRGSTLTVAGVLTRTWNGASVTGRPVVVYARTADTGRWRAAARLRTSSRGRITYRLKDTGRLQITLRFEGDGRYLPAASVTVVPDPSATALRPALVTALAKARAAAKRAGLTLVVNSGYRSFSRQARMYEAAVRQYGSARVARRWVLPAQESTHVRGLAADIGTPATAAWLNRHGAAFGLCRAYGNEPWHVEYRPDWVAAFHGRCPAPVPLPGDPDPLSPRPRVAVRF